MLPGAGDRQTLCGSLTSSLFRTRVKLPNAVAAFVLAHPVGGPEARFFRAHGFDEVNAAELEAGLLDIVRTADVEVVQSPHGMEHVAAGDLPIPSGGLKRGDGGAVVHVDDGAAVVYRLCASETDLLFDASEQERKQRGDDPCSSRLK